MRIDRFENGMVNIRDIPDDMGSEVKLDLLVSGDSDVILTLRNPNIEDILRKARAGVGQEISIQFCTATGGGHNLLVTRKLRELAMLLAEEQNKPVTSKLRELAMLLAEEQNSDNNILE